MLQIKTLQFLEKLSQNNNKEWFHENRPVYEEAKLDFEHLVEQLIGEIGKFQELGNLQPKDCILRINRDIRFSKDKSPYKSHLSAGIGMGGKSSGKIDYYLHIEPNGKSVLGGGMWSPSPENLAKFRQEIDYNAGELKSIIDNPEFQSHFPSTMGSVLKTAPKGYPKTHPEIELLKRKELFFTHRFLDKELIATDLVDNIVSNVKVLKPYCDYLNYIFYGD
jgi:uncharacterized protein (TIGR02453 family)